MLLEQFNSELVALLSDSDPSSLPGSSSSAVSHMLSGLVTPHTPDIPSTPRFPVDMSTLAANQITEQSLAEGIASRKDKFDYVSTTDSSLPLAPPAGQPPVYQRSSHVHTRSSSPTAAVSLAAGVPVHAPAAATSITDIFDEVRSLDSDAAMFFSAKPPCSPPKPPVPVSAAQCSPIKMAVSTPPAAAVVTVPTSPSHSHSAALVESSTAAATITVDDVPLVALAESVHPRHSLLSSPAAPLTGTAPSTCRDTSTTTVNTYLSDNQIVEELDDLFIQQAEEAIHARLYARFDVAKWKYHHEICLVQVLVAARKRLNMRNKKSYDSSSHSSSSSSSPMK